MDDRMDSDLTTRSSSQKCLLSFSKPIFLVMLEVKKYIYVFLSRFLSTCDFVFELYIFENLKKIE